MEIGRFPNRLKTLRRSCGYSRKRVARILGYADTSALSRWELGVALPGLLQTLQLAHLYQTLPHELFDELWERIGGDCSLLASDEEPVTHNQPLYL